MELLKNSVTIRGDSLYCPLCLSIDSYGNCLIDCPHCYIRRLNHTWGKALKPSDTEALRKKLHAGLKNKNPKSTLAHALRNKNTIRWGNKTDPFQLAEREHKIAPKIFNILSELNWSFVIQTRFTHILSDYQRYIDHTNKKNLITIMPVNSPSNDQSNCCEVGDWFGGGLNYGSTVMASRYIQKRGMKPTSWKTFEKYVDKRGGFLTEKLKMDVKELWDLQGNVAYSHRWAPGLVPAGMDEDGVIWKYESDTDYRMDLLNSIIS